MLMKRLKIVAVVVVLVLGFVLQTHYLSSYPQPILFGDPGAYYVVGQRLQQAVARLLSGEELGVVFESVRGLLYFAGVGSVYGLIDSLNPQNIPYFRTVLSVFNTLASLGCFFLAWRLSRSYGGGLLALVFASVYPVVSKNTNELKPHGPGRFGLEVSRLGSPMEARILSHAHADPALDIVGGCHRWLGPA